MEASTAVSADTDYFKTKLAHYKDVIDADLAVYSKHIQKNTLQQFDKNARIEIDAYLSLLERGGKRIRGALVMLGYEMSGGKDTDMILHAARAIEMLHAYILIIDDFQDRSVIRRGGPTAHTLLADFHRQHELSGDSDHFGASVALNAALAGGHVAQTILANLNAPDDLKIKVMSIMNHTMMVTAHGQTSDIMNEVVASVSEADVDRVLEWKTAHYTILNPLHVGMVLAGADCAATDAITEFAMHAGRAFQITDDILGPFGVEHDSGKSPLDDIREGKRTVLAVYALEHATNSDKNFLIQMLGNPNLNQAEFKRCKDILIESGALAYARGQAEQRAEAALKALDKEAHNWSPEGVQFLRGLTNYLLFRQS